MILEIAYQTTSLYISATSDDVTTFKIFAVGPLPGSPASVTPWVFPKRHDAIIQQSRRRMLQEGLVMLSCTGLPPPGIHSPYKGLAT
jgi:hypothetical protein